MGGGISHFEKASLQMIGGFDRAPMIDWRKYPADEQEYIRLLSWQAKLLGMHTRTFSDAVALTDHCFQLKRQKSIDEINTEDMEMRVLWSSWLAIAARDAAFTIYHFRASLLSTKSQLNRAPTLQAKVDYDALDLLCSRFAKEFPNAKELRHAVGHVADLIFKVKDLKEHYPENAPIIMSSYNGDLRRLTMTREKMQLTIDVTNDTLNQLDAIKRDAWAAFRKADELCHEA